MYSKKQLIDGIKREFAILEHLSSKVDKTNAGHKFSEAQRSIQEIEHYIVSSFPAQIKAFVAGKRDLDTYMAYSKNFEDFTWKKFKKELKTALRIIAKDIRSLKGKDRKEEISVRGRTGTRASFLVDYVFAFLGAYKMQMFLQLKNAGLTNLGTSNLWGGVDEPAK